MNQTVYLADTMGELLLFYAIHLFVWLLFFIEPDTEYILELTCFFLQLSIILTIQTYTVDRKVKSNFKKAYTDGWVDPSKSA